MPVVHSAVAPASCNMNIRGYGSRIALRLSGTTWVQFPIRISNSGKIPAALIAPELCFVAALEKQRAQGRPGARCTRGLACKVTSKKRTRAYRFSGNTPAFPAQWFYDLLRALPGDRAFLPPSPSRIAPQELDTSVGVSGPHDFAVHNMRRSSYARRCVHRIPPRR
jgi:hypothetical protein